ncbi:hypothetical protein [Gilliamella sp. wkB112]|uniref:hypothetical protein n=1 Tax=Gilliamella sp. wkB112 TaxID=3120257 RepID=UPI00080ED169|nr:hypothetical protein [Gilliamella apicola]OCG00496.1 hypothetical protein A9G12_05260 [Gilliamella apicola]
MLQHSCLEASQPASRFKIYQLKIVLFSLILFLIPNYSYALTATTVKWIQGTLPYLTFNNGLTKEYGSTALGLLRVKVSNGTSYIPSEHEAYPDAVVDTSSVDDPIMLEATDTFESIETFVTLPSQNNNYPKMEFDQLVVAPYAFWQDADGDELVPLTAKQANLKGNLTVNWKDAFGRDITNSVKSNPKQVLSGCDAPYALTVELHKGVVRTQYGDPSQLTIDNKSHTYYFYPKVIEPKVCFAQPNLEYGDGGYAGPAEQWDPLNGFKLQDINNPESNFPTVGANNLYLKFKLIGITADEFINANGSTMHSNDGSVALELTPESDQIKTHVVRVTLKGPSRAQNGGDAFSPSTFNFYADGGKSNLLYNFRIGHWYIGDVTYVIYSTARNICNGTLPAGTYRTPYVREYTNSGIGGSHYQRKISYKDGNNNITGGLTSEWGNLSSNYYSEGDFVGGTGGWAVETNAFGLRYGGGFAVGNSYYNYDYFNPGFHKVGTGCITP